MSRIIVADDDRVTQIFYRGAIDFLGHEPVLCSNGVEAVEEFKANRADLLILDNQMPQMDGLEACRTIRALPGGAGVPIIIVSGMDDEADIVKGLNAGANDYLIKPVKESHLFAKLKIFLRMSSLHKNDFELAKNHVVFADKFRILKMLGYGSHSIVFLAESVAENNRKIALKLFKQVPDINQVYDAFAETAGKLKRLDSPNILKLHDFGQCDGRLYVAMDYADGGDMARIFKKRTLSQLEAAKAGLDISMAIRDIAAEGIIHFDIKPENIMLSEGRCLLGDFGIVTTRTGTTVPIGREIWGTLAYMPPEFLGDEGMFVGKSDIYSLGVTLYHALTGANPFYSENAGTVMFCVVNLVPDELASICGDFDGELSDTLSRMLAKNPEERPEAGELADNFGRLVRRFAEDRTKSKPTYIPKGKQHAGDDAGEAPEETPPPCRKKVAATVKAKPLPAPPKDVRRKTERPYLSLDISGLLGASGYLLVYVLGACLLLLGVYGIVKISGCIGSSIKSAQDDYVPGTPTVVRCLACGSLDEMKVADIAAVKCRKCSGAVAVAYKCGSCGFIFPFKEEQGKEQSFKCPQCGSEDTDPVPNSREYVAKLEAASKASEERFRKKQP